MEITPEGGATKAGSLDLEELELEELRPKEDALALHYNTAGAKAEKTTPREQP
jgi:hypothetical protein